MLAQLTLIHWTACLWHLLPWLEPATTSWIAEGRVEHSSNLNTVFDLYASSVEFAVMCMVSVFEPKQVTS
jgi:hypothetical protein